ncbi:cupin domain-containing protein [Streptomyces sp. NPDC087263]|uniref:cupin domain-containing protein n=1 Tax=Streptomyces sp. NPDC087263 TaxID=3365773 RepID=UPI0038261A9F
MDPLSHVLSLSKVESAVCAELRAGGDWAVTFPGQLHVKFGVVLAGSCWLTLEGAEAPLRLRDGDGYLVVGGRPYQLSSDPRAVRVLLEAVWAPGQERGHCGTGLDTTLIGGRLTFDRANADLLLKALPPVIHLAVDSDETGALRATMRLIAHETATPRSGQTLMLDRGIGLSVNSPKRQACRDRPFLTHSGVPSEQFRRNTC